MANQTTSVPGTGYENVYLDSLIWGCKWTGGPVNYAFGSGTVPETESMIGTFSGKSWLDSEKTAFRTALNNYSSVCNLKFAETSDTAAANAVFFLARGEAMPGYLGINEVPDGNSSQTYGYFNADADTWSNLNVGSDGYMTILHELGHAMGLAHPHDGGGESDATLFPGVKDPFGSYGTYSMNQGIWTTMSYNVGWIDEPSYSQDYGLQGSLMALDIAALQTLYGANTKTATGNDTYVLPDESADGTYWRCIWDAGGKDTISNAGSSLDAVINLNAAPLVGPNAGGFVSWNPGVPGGFTIAHNVVIENATGGSGNDRLTGNAAANVLNGGTGSDTMAGGAGNDIYYVNARSDVVTELSGEGSDCVYSSLAAYTLGSNIERGRILADGTANLTGNGLNNVLYAGNGNNVLTGGNGNDTVSYSKAGTGVTVSLAAVTAQNTGGSGSDTLVSIEHLTGSAYADRLAGNGGANVLTGGAGNDILSGKLGNDILTGGSGNDVFSFNTKLGTASVPNIDRITDFNAADDFIQLENAIFTKLTTTGSLSAGNLVSNRAPHALDANDYLLHDQSTGNLYYDADGNGAGAAVQIAIVGIGVSLQAADIIVV